MSFVKAETYEEVYGPAILNPEVEEGLTDAEPLIAVDHLAPNAEALRDRIIELLNRYGLED